MTGPTRQVGLRIESIRPEEIDGDTRALVSGLVARMLAVTSWPRVGGRSGSVVFGVDPVSGATVLAAGLRADAVPEEHSGLMELAAPIFGGSLAVAMHYPCSGASLGAAILAGWETGLLLGEVVGLGSARLAPLAATAAAVGSARVLGLDGDRLLSAIGIGASSSVGAAVAPDAAWQAGKSASNGVLAALLAAAGFTGPADALEHPRGVLGAAFGVRLPAGVAERFGNRVGAMSPLVASVRPADAIGEDGGQAMGDGERVRVSRRGISRPDVPMTGTAALRRLAGFAVGSIDLPGEVAHTGRRTLLNALALAVGAARHPAVEAACEVVQSLSHRSEATIPGRPVRVEAEWAAFVGGIGVHAEDYDDTHLETVVHPGAPVVPAAHAFGELCRSSGRELLEAVVVGVEVACRMGLGLGPGHFERGWHLTGSTGRYGAAAAAARLAGLDETTLAGVWARCAAETAGVQAAFGTMTKPYHPGKAAYDGVLAVRDALGGRTPAPMSMDEETHMFEALGPDPDPRRVTSGLGEQWETVLNTFKPYACGIVSHPVIDAAVEARSRIAGGITRIMVTVNPIVLDVMGVEEPANGLESKFSVYHCAAIGLLDGMGGPVQFSDDRVNSPDAGALRRKVEVITDPSLARDAARLAVDLADGERVEVGIDHARGSVERPMNDEDLAFKARAAMQPIIGDAADDLIDMVYFIEDYGAQDVMRLAAAGALR